LSLIVKDSITLIPVDILSEMDAIQAILSRRSIRKFTGGDIPNEKIKALLDAAMVAPSACDQQPWHFIVVKNKETLRHIAGEIPTSGMLARGAAAAIIVCADPSLEVCAGYWVQDCSAATENLLLAAHAMGYGATWCGIYPIDDRVWKLNEMFGVPKQVIPMCIVALGVPAEEKSPVKRYKTERVHAEKW
jgi:nitroreductase